jgi:S1-C subfamily serine protease
MKWLFGLFALAFIGCAPVEKYVKLSDKCSPKTVMIEVHAVTTIVELVFTENGIDIVESTVAVRVRGAGVYVSPEGHILTCDHLFSFDEIDDVIISEYSGGMYSAEILFREERLDLALLKVNPDRPVAFARIADPRKLRVGQEVMAIGNPLGFDFSVSHGIISSLYRDGLGVPNMTQSDAFLNPGNSGGPLFNLKGELVGINSRIVPPIRANVFTGLGFSVQCGQIIEFLTRFRGIDKAIPHFNLKYWKQYVKSLGL